MGMGIYSISFCCWKTLKELACVQQTEGANCGPKHCVRPLSGPRRVDSESLQSLFTLGIF